MSLLIGLLTFLLVVNCLFLMLLVLIQLPKKEAGAGVAFGGGATDALFGAGSGNALTNVTKYAATIFVCMSLLLSWMNGHRAKESNRRLESELLKKAGAAAPAIPGLTPTSQTGPSATTAVQGTPAAPATAVVAPAAQQAETPAVSIQATPTTATPPPATTSPSPSAAPTVSPATSSPATPAPPK